ncbi:MAG: SMC-Scp complex subunit ScpB [Bacteriovoracaceae bacterium]|nr:SMC-Scp complex subunit ScpB [Bacteriovoracaceae bacterium]
MNINEENENNDTVLVNEVPPQLPDNIEVASEKESEIENEGQTDLDRIHYIGLNSETLTAAIETIIFLSEKPISTNKIRDAIDPTLSLRIIHSSIQILQKEFELQHHGIRLYEVADGWQFRTKAYYSKFIKEHVKIAPLQLTPLSLELLSMIAFKQPITKVEVDRLRGVDSGHLLRGLMDKKLIKIVGKTDDAIKSTQYATTQDFLEIFNFNKVEDLPSYTELEELAQGNTVGEIQDIKAIIENKDKDKFVFDELSELDQLSENIKNISVNTEFTSLFNKKSSDTNGVVAPAVGLSDLLESYLSQKELKEENQRSSQSPYPIDSAESNIPNVPNVESETIVLNEKTVSIEESPDTEIDFLSKELDHAFERMREKDL